MVSGIFGLWTPAVDFAREHAVMGWGIAVAILVMALIVGLWQHYGYETKLAAARVKEKQALDAAGEERGQALEAARAEGASSRVMWEHRARADISLTESLLGEFTEGGSARDGLENLPVDKRFSRHLARELEEVLEKWERNTKPIHDQVVSSAITQSMNALRAYTDAVLPQLDAPAQLEGTSWELIITEPPGGEWGNNWDAYYTFVRSLTPLRFKFLSSLREFDGALYAVKVKLGEFDN